MSKLEVRNVKVMESLSEETTCYTASVYWEGRRVGTASNRGCGGESIVHFTSQEQHAAVKAWVKANPSQSGTPDEAFTNETIEDYVDQLVTDWQYTEQVKRLTRKKIAYAEDGKLWVTTPRASPGVSTEAAFAAHIKALKARRPNVIVLNELPLEEAVSLYLKYGAR